jgi:hypothetical protein
MKARSGRASRQTARERSIREVVKEDNKTVSTPALEFVLALARHQAWLDTRCRRSASLIDPSLLTSTD